MSRKREVVGQDERGRPIARWEAGDAPARQFGHMEPAIDTTVDRRRLTPEELAARIGPEPVSAIKPVRRPDPGAAAHMQQSRMKGARRHVEVAAAIRAASTKEEPVVTEPAPADPLLELAEAARAAAKARDVAQAADIAAVVAREAWYRAVDQVAVAYAAAYLSAPAETGRPAEPAVDRAPDHADTTADPDLEPAGEPAGRSRPGGSDARAREADQRGREVLAALERHGGDTRKAGLELGMRGNVVGRIASAARAREAKAAS